MKHIRPCLAVANVFLLLVLGCERRLPERTATTSSASSQAKPERLQETDTSYRHTAQGRVVAIGDLHGDLDATRRALRTAQVIDDKDAWSGGTSVLVQTGDILDRGDDERAILDLFERLREEAKSAGGAVHVLLGNHEVMNVEGDFRYVTRAGFMSFENVASPHNPKIEKKYELPERWRALAFAPQGPYAKRLAQHDTVVMVNDTLFVHGGVLPKHVHYGLGKINQEVKAWMRGDRTSLPAPMSVDDAPTWSRHFSSPQVDEASCRALGTALDLVGAKRMVIGHTPQKDGINSACNERVWRIDVGLASHYGHNPSQALEIDKNKVQALREQSANP